MINLSTKNFDLTEGIHSKFEKVLEKVTNSAGDNIRIDAHIERTTSHHKKGDIYKIHAIARTSNKRYDAEVHGEVVYNLIDEIGQKLEREIRDDSDRERNKERSFARKIKDSIRGINPFA